MAHTVFHPSPHRGPRRSGTPSAPGARAVRPGSGGPGAGVLVSAGAGLLAGAGALTALGALTTSWPAVLAFALWWFATVAWADTVQRTMPWAVSVALGLALLLAASVLPSRTLPPADAGTLAAAVASAAGTGFALGPLVAGLGRAARRLRHRGP